MPTEQQRQWLQRAIGIAPGPPAVAQADAAPPSGDLTGVPPDTAVEQALKQLEAVNQRLVALGVPAKDGDDRVAKLRAREAAAAADPKAEQALLKDIETARDAAEKTEDLLKEIQSILAEADAEVTQMVADGLPAGPVGGAVAELHKKLVPAAQHSPQSLASLRKLAIQARDRLKDDYDKQRTAIGSGALNAIKDMRDTAGTQIGLIADNAAKKPLSDDLDALNKQITALEQEKDPTKFATERDAADAAARILLDKAVKASSDLDAKSALRGAYQKALKERYGIDLKGDQKQVADHIDLAKVYETLESMPPGHAANTALMKIGYDPVNLKSGGHGIGRYSPSAMEMDLGDNMDGDTGGYVDPTHPKDKLTVPRLAITVLHELGHSVDERWGIMGGDIGKDSYGGWRSVGRGTFADVGAELAGHYLGSGAAGGASKDSLTSAIVAVLMKASNIQRPADMTDDAAWKAFEKFLGRCANFKEASFDGRGYALPFGVDHGWHSYSRAVRDSTQVTNYQWTAPPEWFAELYAMTWYAKRDPPASVDAQVKQYLYSSKSGGTGPGVPAP
jgi:hypothetical protein